MKYRHAIVGWMLTALVDEQREVVLAVLVEEVFADLLRALAGLSVSEKKKDWDCEDGIGKEKTNRRCSPCVHRTLRRSRRLGRRNGLA